jgi:hypothetical protein
LGARRRAVILPIRRRSCWARNALVLTSLISGPGSRARYGSISTSVIRVHGVVAPSTEAQALLAYLMSLKQTTWPANKTAAGPAPAPSEQPATSGVPATQALAAGMSAAPTTSGYDADKGKHPNIYSAPIARPATRRLGKVSLGRSHRSVVNEGNSAKHIHTVLFGLEGATVGGVKYESAMPPLLAPCSTTLTSPRSSIMSAAPGAITVSL